MTEQQEGPKTPEEYKSQALLERIAQLTAQYENQVADFRVAYTILTQEKEELAAKLEHYETSTEVSASE